MSEFNKSFHDRTSLREFHDVKKHCISYQTESLMFCKLLLFFQNNVRIADSLLLYVVYDNSLYCFILH